MKAIHSAPAIRSILVSAILPFFLLLCPFASPVRAQVNVTGSWTGFSFAGGASYFNSFAFVQSGTKLVGSAVAGNAPGVITGTIAGNQMTFHSEYPSIKYSSDAVATTDGQTISGTFLDSQGTSGTFTAQKALVPLTPNLPLLNPPVVQIPKGGGGAKFTLQMFSDAEEPAPGSRRAASSGATIRYEVTLRGPERRKLSSKRNTVTVRDLSAGRYSVSYSASALRKGRSIFKSSKSPNAVFVVPRGAG